VRELSTNRHNVHARTYKRELVASRWCINGKSHGRATHGVRCRHCYDVHSGVHPSLAAPIVRDGTEQAFREQGILFKEDMVVAIDRRLKWQTRRIVKPQPEPNKQYGGYHWPSKYAQSMVDTKEMAAFSPYGWKRDRLWVRETWCWASPEDPPPTDDRPRDAAGRSVYYRALDRDIVAANESRSPWKSPIHLPRWASRITLEISKIRVERLHDISEKDAWAEGVEVLDGKIPSAKICAGAKLAGCSHEDARATFAALWCMINGELSWKANPWLWVLEFHRIDRQGNRYG
jgi:hypothetical protein